MRIDRILWQCDRCKLELIEEHELERGSSESLKESSIFMPKDWGRILLKDKDGEQYMGNLCKDCNISHEKFQKERFRLYNETFKAWMEMK